jgi:hypothetical protein
MLSNAAHFKADQRKQLVGPKEHTVEMPQCAPHLQLPASHPRHIVEKMQRHKSHEGDTLLELMANAYNLKLVHVEFIPGIVMTLNRLDKADGFGWTVSSHTAFCAVNTNTRNSFCHYPFPACTWLPPACRCAVLTACSTVSLCFTDRTPLLKTWICNLCLLA